MKNIPVDAELLYLFKALIETRSLTLAANRLGMSQAAASRALTKLRTLFADNLFIKSGYGMLATPRAEALFPRVLATLSQLEHLLEPEHFSPQELSRILRVGSVDNGVFTILPPVLRQLFIQAPKARLEIVPIDDNLFTLLKNGQMDLAIYPIQPLPPDFHEMNLFEASYSCVVRKGHPLDDYAQKNGAPPIEEVNRYRRMQISVHGGRQGYVLDEEAFIGKSEQEIAMWVPYFLAAPLVLAETDFVLTLPTQTALRFAEMAPLVVLPYPLQTRTFFTRLVWHHRVHHDPAIQWLRSLFVKYVAGKTTPSSTGQRT